jgi:hypothetical protein
MSIARCARTQRYRSEGPHADDSGAVRGSSGARSRRLMAITQVGSATDTAARMALRSLDLEHGKETRAILAKYVKIDDRAVSREAYEEVVPYLMKNPIPDTKAVQSALYELSAATPEAKTADPTAFVDRSFTHHLQSSGFVDGLYK